MPKNQWGVFQVNRQVVRGGVLAFSAVVLVFSFQNCSEPFRISERAAESEGSSSGQPQATQPPLRVPYNLPKPGEAVSIGVNSAMSLIPSDEGWDSMAWGYSLFDSFGGGAFVPTYSEVGGYVIAGSGGHGHPDNPSAVVFDFETATWSRLENANGVRRKGYPFVFSVAESNGSPWYEFPGTEVPLPAHPYANLAFMPDGEKGSVIYVGRAAVAGEAVDPQTSHRFDLATRRWTRATNELMLGGRSQVESDAVWDEARNRWWYINSVMHNYLSLTYLDRSDLKWKEVAGMTDYQSSAIAGYGRVMLHDGLLIKNNQSQGLWMVDPDRVFEGWRRLTVDGTLPKDQDRWARYSDGNWYSFQGSPGNQITRIRPPSNPKTGVWVVDSVAVSGASLPPKAGLHNPSSLSHYTRFFYVPKLDCLAWIPGGGNSVYLLKPGPVSN